MSAEPQTDMPEAWDEARAIEIIDAHKGLEGPMLPIAHALQAAFGCIPREAVPLIAHALNLSRAEVHGTISFYHDFRSEPAGRRTLRLCRAEACQSLGGRALAEDLLARLGIAWGGTTRNGDLTVEPVYCLGLCAVAPAALVDGEPVGRLDPARLAALLGDAP
jgi:formate dehydrogenase subunit gamma